MLDQYSGNALYGVLVPSMRTGPCCLLHCSWSQTQKICCRVQPVTCPIAYQMPITKQTPRVRTCLDRACKPSDGAESDQSINIFIRVVWVSNDHLTNHDILYPEEESWAC